MTPRNFRMPARLERIDRLNSQEGELMRSRRAARYWALIVILALALPAAAVAKVHPGQLDKRFGRGGKAVVAFPGESPGDVGVKYEVPFQFTPGHLQMAMAPGGKIVIASSMRLARLLPNGKLDRSFGSGGIVPVERPPGQTFLLADVAVDSLGRILLGGSARPLPTASSPDPLTSWAMVRRYSADGSLDPGFGSGGTVETDFGIEPPKIGDGHWTGPAVGLRGMVVDANNRPLVTGGSVTEICGSSTRSANTAFVARLTEAGAQDPGFGEGGVRQVPDFGSLAQGHLFPSGDLLALATPGAPCSGSASHLALSSFGPSGSLAPGFGFAGLRTIGFTQAPVVALAPSGKILLLGPKRGHKRNASQLIARLLPSGTFDPGFGRTGRVQLFFPKSSGFGAIAADGKERVLLGGHVTRKLPRGARRATFALVRMKPKGTVDRSFGRRGSVRTGFGGPASAWATQVMVRGGRILVGGLVSTPRLTTGGGFAVSRYFGR